MNSPAAICRQLELEERRRPGNGPRPREVEGGPAEVGLTRYDKERRRAPLPIVPTEAMVRAAELEAGMAQHELDTADPEITPEHRDRLRRRAGELRATARRLRAALA